MDSTRIFYEDNDGIRGVLHAKHYTIDKDGRFNASGGDVKLDLDPEKIHFPEPWINDSLWSKEKLSIKDIKDIEDRSMNYAEKRVKEQVDRVVIRLIDFGETPVKTKAIEKMKSQCPLALEYLRKCIFNCGCKRVYSFPLCMGGWKDENYKDKEPCDTPSIDAEIVEDILEHYGCVFWTRGAMYALEDEFIDLIKNDLS